MKRVFGLLVVLGAIVGVLALQEHARDRSASGRRALGDAHRTPSLPAEAAAPEPAPGAGDPATDEATVIAGVVHGRETVLWGARVVLLEADGTPELARTWTDPEGRFRFETPTDVPVMVRVEPDPETHLQPALRGPLLPAPGETLALSIALASGRSVRGRLVDGDGRPRPGVLLMAVRRDDLYAAGAGEFPHSAMLGPVSQATARTGDDGRFEFHTLGDGVHRLLVKSSDLRIEPPVYFWGDEGPITARAVGCAGFALEVRDIETRARIPRFEVGVRFGEGAGGVTVPGADGRAAAKPAWPASLASAKGWVRRAELTVRAPGYRPAAQLLMTGAGGPVALWLQPDRPPNGTLVVRLPGRRLFQGRVRVWFKAARDGRGGEAPVTPSGPSRFAVALPRGAWRVTAAAAGLLLPEFEFEVNVEGNGAWHRVWDVLPGGALIVRWADWSPGKSLMVQVRSLAEQGPRGGWSLTTRIDAAESRFEATPPGDYRFSFLDVRPDRVVESVLFATTSAKVVAGGVTVVDVPPLHAQR